MKPRKEMAAMENETVKTRQTRSKALTIAPMLLPKPHVNFQQFRPATPSKNLTEIVCLTSYPPRECGIATYSKDLQKVLTDKFGESFTLSTYALESGDSKPDYTERIVGTLNTDSALDFLQAAYHINSNDTVGLVLIQHEFGLFRGNEHAFNEFLEYLDKPVLLTFHSVLPDPSTSLKRKVNTLASLTTGIIVMTQTSKKILIEKYGISPDKITVIAHGTHLIEYRNKKDLKVKYGLKGRTVLSTFGLLGPGKSIETTLEALPAITKQKPDVVFLVIGRTHPNLVKENGEAYRHFLKDKVNALGLQGHVRFIDQFVPLENLLEYLQLTDIYLFTSKDPNQAVSGTFIYALSAGCPIVSTPIPHALEVLQNNAGTLFDFEDSEQLRQTILDLLENEEERLRMRLNGLSTSFASAWENAAIAHAKLFEKTYEKPLTLKYKKPPIDLRHIKKMTTDVGIVQFSKINRPDIESGYTLDDNARALIALCQHYELTDDVSDLTYIRIYANFIVRCFRHDGSFLNYVDKQRQFTDQNDSVNLEDACGRALWALGYLLSISSRLPTEYRPLVDNIHFIYNHAIKATVEFRSPRAMAFIIKGIYYYNTIDDRECMNPFITEYADRLVSSYTKESDKDWQWFEGSLTYDNSVLPEAMLMAYVMTLKPPYRKIAQESFDFLLSRIFNEGMIQVVSNKDWHLRGETMDPEFTGGEQPIDVAYAILALRLFHKIFPKAGYETFMENAFDWFLGKNPLNQTLYNPRTAGCHDGLELNNINLNQGAESTIGYLLARMAFENSSL